MNGFFFDSIEHYNENIALIEKERTWTYRSFCQIADSIVENIPKRSLVFLVCTNTVASIAAYVGCLRKRIVPVLISKTIDKSLYYALLEKYEPRFVLCPTDFIEGMGCAQFEGYKLVKNSDKTIDMHKNLAVLLTTSGSTGSPKFVRQSYENIESNTNSIVKYLEINTSDRAITTLPMNYTYGLSIIQTHLFAGATLVLTEYSLFDKCFWEMVKAKEVTTFGGVPYTYQMLDRLRFLNMDLPSLRYITQAGGHLSKELHEKFARGMQDKSKKFIVMYGAAEATARMSYVPAVHTIEKAGSIGIPIPGGRFEISNDGELIYYGNNVTLGYAESKEDLAKDDERCGRLETGDMATKDEDGYYYIVGRKKRFLKIFGNRVNLAEIENILYSAGYETACIGEDDHMRIYTTSKENSLEEIEEYISQKTSLNRLAFKAIHIDQIPRNESGKVLYTLLK